MEGWVPYRAPQAQQVAISYRKSARRQRGRHQERQSALK